MLNSSYENKIWRYMKNMTILLNINTKNFFLMSKSFMAPVQNGHTDLQISRSIESNGQVLDLSHSLQNVDTWLLSSVHKTAYNLSRTASFGNAFFQSQA